MRLAKLAWHSVTKETIKNCWRHTGIIDFKDGVEYAILLLIHTLPCHH
jgi:hypothetical protein